MPECQKLQMVGYTSMAKCKALTGSAVKRLKGTLQQKEVFIVSLILILGLDTYNYYCDSSLVADIWHVKLHVVVIMNSRNEGYASHLQYLHLRLCLELLDCSDVQLLHIR